VLLLDEPMGALDNFTRADLQDKLLEIWEADRTTMILVTHDVDEAIYLSDRIFVMTARPGRIREVIDVNAALHQPPLPRTPRNRAGVDFLQLRKRVLLTLDLATSHPEPEYRL